MILIDSILDLWGTSQLTAFFLSGTLLQGGYQWAIGLTLSILLWAVCGVLGAMTGSIKNLKDMHRVYFDKSAEFEFDEFNVIKLVPEALRDSLLYRKSFWNPALRKLLDLPAVFQPIRAFVVRRSKPPYPAQLKAFVNPGGTSALFLRDRPEGLSLIGRFKLYHELGHLTRFGAVLAGEKFAVVNRRTFTLVIVALSYPRSLWTWALMLVFFLHQLYREKIIVSRGCEMDADAFAFDAIGDAESQKRVLEQLETLTEEDSLNSSSQENRIFNNITDWRLILLNQKKNRLAKGRSLPPGITYTGLDDWLLSLLFALLGCYSPLPGAIPLVILLSLIILYLFFVIKASGVLPAFEEDIEGILRSQNVANLGSELAR